MSNKTFYTALAILGLMAFVLFFFAAPAYDLTTVVADVQRTGQTISPTYVPTTVSSKDFSSVVVYALEGDLSVLESLCNDPLLGPSAIIHTSCGSTREANGRVGDPTHTPEPVVSTVTETPEPTETAAVITPPPSTTAPPSSTSTPPLSTTTPPPTNAPTEVIITTTPPPPSTSTPPPPTTTPLPDASPQPEGCDGGNPGNLGCNGNAGEDPNGRGTMDDDSTDGNGEHGNQDVKPGKDK